MKEISFDFNTITLCALSDCERHAGKAVAAILGDAIYNPAGQTKFPPIGNLFITGPQGSGKSMLADLIANAYGPAMKVEGYDTEDRFFLGHMDEQAKVLIVDDVRFIEHLKVLKHLATTPHWTIHAKMEKPRTIERIPIIAMADQVRACSLMEGIGPGRHFQLIELGPRS